MGICSKTLHFSRYGVKRRRSCLRDIKLPSIISYILSPYLPIMCIIGEVLMGTRLNAPSTLIHLQNTTDSLSNWNDPTLKFLKIHHSLSVKVNWFTLFILDRLIGHIAHSLWRCDQAVPDWQRWPVCFRCGSYTVHIHVISESIWQIMISIQI